MSQNNGKVISKYIKAIKKGDVFALESLAISVGYTEPYFGWMVLKDAKTRLESSLLDPEISDYAVPLLTEFDIFCDKIMPYISERYRNSRQFRRAFKIPTNEDMEKISPKERAKHIKKYIEKIDYFTGPFWANKQAGFIRTKKGPKPHNNSMVAYISWISKSEDGLEIIKPENRRLFMDVFDKDPLWEGKLDWGVYASIHNERADKLENGEEIEPYIFGEIDGSGPHEINFGPDQVEEAREYADGLRINWGMENLIYGEKVVKHLFNLAEGKPDRSFPLSKEGYEKLIGLKKDEIAELKKDIGNHSREEIRIMTKDANEQIKRKKANEIQKFSEKTMKDMKIATAFYNLRKEEPKLKRLEKAASLL